MQVLNQLTLKLEKFEKCHFVCENDCPVGTIYDYATALQAFCIQKMQEAQPKKESSEEKESS